LGNQQETNKIKEIINKKTKKIIERKFTIFTPLYKLVIIVLKFYFIIKKKQNLKFLYKIILNL